LFWCEVVKRRSVFPAQWAQDCKDGLMKATESGMLNVWRRRAYAASGQDRSTWRKPDCRRDNKAGLIADVIDLTQNLVVPCSPTMAPWERESAIGRAL
jgi:hypothetical protein